MEQLHPHDPHRIGPYRLLSRLGAGGTGASGTGGLGGRGGAGGAGQVFLAHSDRGRTVAVKLLHPELAAHEAFRFRFRQGVAAARGVGGEWTAPVLDADTEAAISWVATAYIAGPSLRQVVAHDFGPLPPRTVRVLGAGLAYALQDLHRAGLAHGDLKPSHILLTLDGPRVIDLGIARAAAGTGLMRNGSSGFLGSPGFLAPGRLGGEPASASVSAACDVYRLGAVLAYAATGRLPAEVEPDLDGVPPDLHDLVRDCLERDATSRPEPAEVLARLGADDAVADGRALEPWLPEPLVAQLGRHAVRLLDREEAGPDRADLPPPPPVPPSYSAYTPPQAESPVRPPWSASTALLLAVAAVVAVLSAGTVYAVMSGAEDPRPPTGGTARPGPVSSSASTSASASASASGLAGGLPEAYLGTWQAVRGSQTWQLTLARGAPGEEVMTLSVQDPGFSCAWTAPLHGAATGPVELGPSAVTSGTPPTCTPGAGSRLFLQPDGTLRRELTGGDAPPLDYTRQ
ncbi:serine/threonine-protein kinase [Streptomyces sp. NPDC047014]|uniref:serine/threonine-protein kinase n=1 Tax=Streptomyces sp. NPDC047014 TaxID=3155736 RepID=UPI0033D62E02